VSNPSLEVVAAAVADAVVDDQCLVALGGGADSSVLLWAAVEALGSDRVRSVFVYHGLEGSDDLRSAATAVSDTCGVTCTVIERIVPDGGNLEARARAARYEAIEENLPEGTVALTGHTADDQAETVLMRLLRGSGTGALGGIPSRRGAWRRPLLGISRAELRAAAERLGLPFTDDPANTDRRFMRSRIRHDVMPVIEENFGPDAPARIRRSSRLLAADDAILEAAARKVPIVATVGGVSIPIGPLVSLSQPTASRVVRRALRIMLDEYPGTAADVEVVLSVAHGGGPSTISGALQVVSEPPFVSIFTSDTAPNPEHISLSVGEPFDWFGSTYATDITSHAPPSIAGGRFTVLRHAAVGADLALRGSEPGDRIDIGTGSTPVKEVLRTAGIPARLRPHSLVVTVDAKIAALAGVRVASWARANYGEQAVIIEREVGAWIET